MSLGSALSWEEDFFLELALKAPIILPLVTTSLPWSTWHKLPLLSQARLSAMETNSDDSPRVGFLSPVPSRALAVCNGTL